MSLDFDSAALQTQHEDEDYDQEDYAREQEVKKGKLFDLKAWVSGFFPSLSFVKKKIHAGFVKSKTECKLRCARVA